MLDNYIMEKLGNEVLKTQDISNEVNY